MIFGSACVFFTFSMQNRCGPLLPISSPKPPTGTLKSLSQSLQLWKTYFWEWILTFEYIILTQSIFVNMDHCNDLMRKKNDIFRTFGTVKVANTEHGTNITRTNKPASAADELKKSRPCLAVHSLKKICYYKTSTMRHQVRWYFVKHEGRLDI